MKKTFDTGELTSLRLFVNTFWDLFRRIRTLYHDWVVVLIITHPLDMHLLYSLLWRTRLFIIPDVNYKKRLIQFHSSPFHFFARSPYALVA